MKYYERKLNLELDKFKIILWDKYNKDVWNLFKLVYAFSLLADWLISIKELYLTKKYDNLKIEHYIITIKSSLINSLKIALLSLEHELYLDYRNILESLLKYFYFLENPMKYVIYNWDNYISFSNDLIEYFKKHPYFKPYVSTNLWEIKKIYWEISEKLHDPILSKIKNTNFLNEIEYDANIISWWLKMFEKMFKKLVFFSAIFNKNIINDLPNESRDLIISIMKDKDFNKIIWR